MGLIKNILLSKVKRQGSNGSCMPIYKYYQCSPVIVKAMEEDEEFKEEVKEMMD